MQRQHAKKRDNWTLSPPTWAVVHPLGMLLPLRCFAHGSVCLVICLCMYTGHELHLPSPSHVGLLLKQKSTDVGTSGYHTGPLGMSELTLAAALYKLLRYGLNNINKFEPHYGLSSPCSPDTSSITLNLPWCRFLLRCPSSHQKPLLLVSIFCQLCSIHLDTMRNPTAADAVHEEQVSICQPVFSAAAALTPADAPAMRSTLAYDESALLLRCSSSRANPHIRRSACIGFQGSWLNAIKAPELHSQEQQMDRSSIAAFSALFCYCEMAAFVPREPQQLSSARQQQAAVNTPVPTESLCNCWWSAMVSSLSCSSYQRPRHCQWLLVQCSESSDLRDCRCSSSLSFSAM